MTSVIDAQGGKLLIVDAHRDDRRRFIVQSDEILTAFLKLENAIQSEVRC